MSFVIQVKAFDKSFKVVKCVSTTIVSSNINEVIRAVLDFFIQTFYNHKKAENVYKRTKIKNAPKKHLGGKQSLIHLFAFCAFAWASLCLLVLFVLFCAFFCFFWFLCMWNLFVKKKKFKTALITSFILLLIEYAFSYRNPQNQVSFLSHLFCFGLVQNLSLSLTHKFLYQSKHFCSIWKQCLSRNVQVNNSHL